VGLSSSDSEATRRGPSPGARVFGRYTLAAVLGRGGMGVVWRARDELLGEDVALKFLPEVVRWDPGAYADLKAETRRARQLTHPNIVRIHDFVEDADGAAISMELVDGVTLTARRLERPEQVLEPEEIARWLPELGAALDYAHQEGRVVHRDLKPTNVMLAPDGRIKITDFGVARGLAESISRVSMVSAGTLVYMSPQQAMGEDPSAADDIYALGATLYELLTGKPPFHAGDIRSQLFQRRPDSLRARRIRLGRTPGAIPPHWEEAIAACLAKEPERRPASAGELVRRLTASRGPVRAGWRRRLSRRTWMLGGAAAALAATWFLAPGVSLGWVAGGAGVESAEENGRVLAAWNLDGDGREGSGRGLHAATAEVIPAPDRFGRLDRALRFNGRADLAVADTPLLRWPAAQPFTAAIWLQHEESADVTGAFWGARGERVGSFAWSFVLKGGRLGVALGAVQDDSLRCVVESARELQAGTWYHLAVVSDGRKVVLHLDGQPVGEQALGRLRAAPAPEQTEMRFARAYRLQTWVLNGVLDEARVWRRALAAAEVARLAGREAPPRMVVTRGLYPETEDLKAAVREEFGPAAQLLDWQEIKRWHGEAITAWMDELDLRKTAQNGWVQHGGRRIHEGRRHYFISRFDGEKPPYFLAHDEIGGDALLLGSWHGPRVPALALLPPARISREPLLPAGADGVLRRELPLPAGTQALALAWRVALRAGQTGRQVARLRLKDGREWTVLCEPRADAAVAIAFTGPAGTVRTTNRPIGYGETEFTLVVRDRRLRFAAVNVVGASPWFNETVPIEGFHVDDVRAIELEPGGVVGPGSATLSIE
jgi:hypothetical protein